MKYTIAEMFGRKTLLRHGEPVGTPNNCELEFWYEIQELQEKVKELEKARDFHIESVAKHVEKAREEL